MAIWLSCAGIGSEREQADIVTVVLKRCYRQVSNSEYAFPDSSPGSASATTCSSPGWHNLRTWEPNRRQGRRRSKQTCRQYLGADDRYYLGIAFENLGNAGAAQQQFATSASLLPGRNPQVYLHLYNMYLKMNRPDDALATLEDFLRYFPNDPNRKTVEDHIKKLREALKKP